MLELRWLPPDLRRLDDDPTEAFALPFFEDERPLRGALGLADWRLCGQISRGILSGQYRGLRSERVLIPGEPRLRVEKLLLVGLGRSTEFDEAAYDEAVHEIFRSLEDLRVRSAHCVLPGRSMKVVEAERATARFLEIAEGYTQQDEITLIDDAEAQKAITAVVEQARRRARAMR